MKIERIKGGSESSFGVAHFPFTMIDILRHGSHPSGARTPIRLASKPGPIPTPAKAPANLKMHRQSKKSHEKQPRWGCGTGPWPVARLNPPSMPSETGHGRIRQSGRPDRATRYRTMDGNPVGSRAWSLRPSRSSGGTGEWEEIHREKSEGFCVLDHQPYCAWSSRTHAA